MRDIIYGRLISSACWWPKAHAQLVQKCISLHVPSGSVDFLNNTISAMIGLWLGKLCKWTNCKCVVQSGNKTTDVEKNKQNLTNVSFTNSTKQQKDIDVKASIVKSTSCQ